MLFIHCDNSVFLREKLVVQMKQLNKCTVDPESIPGQSILKSPNGSANRRFHSALIYVHPVCRLKSDLQAALLLLLQVCRI